MRTGGMMNSIIHAQHLVAPVQTFCARGESWEEIYLWGRELGSTYLHLLYTHILFSEELADSATQFRHSSRRLKQKVQVQVIIVKLSDTIKVLQFI